MTDSYRKCRLGCSYWWNTICNPGFLETSLSEERASEQVSIRTQPSRMSACGNPGPQAYRPSRTPTELMRSQTRRHVEHMNKDTGMPLSRLYFCLLTESSDEINAGLLSLRYNSTNRFCSLASTEYILEDQSSEVGTATAIICPSHTCGETVILSWLAEYARQARVVPVIRSDQT